MILPFVHIIARKYIGKHFFVGASARGHVGGGFKFGRLRVAKMANKSHTRYFSWSGKKFYIRRKI